MYGKEVDAFRGSAWISKLEAATGNKVRYSLARALDQQSIWRDAAKSGHQSKWYGFSRGRVPHRSLVERVAKAVPNARFEVWHPAWRFLSNPACSTRTDRRLCKEMGEEWNVKLNKIVTLETSRLRLGPWLLTVTGLRRMSFLDALLLFAIARKRSALKHEDAERDEAFVFLLLTLPILYAGDVIWSTAAADESEPDALLTRKLLQLIDRCLSLNTGVESQLCFPVIEREKALGWIRRQARFHRQRHPRALSSRSAHVGFAASFLDGRVPVSIRCAFGPFKLVNGLALRPPVGRAVDAATWRWAWHHIDAGRYPRRIEVSEVERFRQRSSPART